VDGFLVRLDNEGSFASADEADVEWLVRHGCVVMEMDGAMPGRNDYVIRRVKFIGFS
jgi:hypothetical protein